MSKKEDQAKIKIGIKMVEESFAKILDALDLVYGLDWKYDENFYHTPRRVAKALIHEKCRGINSEEECKKILNVTFPKNYNGIISSGPIEAFSLCPHHFEVVKYKIYFAYIPNGKQIGLSKIPRSIKLFAAQPIIQEDFTKKYIDMFESIIQPKGSILIVHGQHGCMTCRGVMVSDQYYVTTSEIRGVFDEDTIKQEFLNMLNLPK